MIDSTGSLSRAAFGSTSDRQPVELFTLVNARGAVAKVTTYGATLTELRLPDRRGALANIVLGFDNVADYERPENPHCGGTIGRYANRIGGGQFSVDGKTYTLGKNDRGASCLHGGFQGFDRHVWSVPAAAPASAPASALGPQVKLIRTSAEGEEGFPGNLSVSVTYTLTDDNVLRIEYCATTDKTTPVNLTHHSYFNLSGAGSGDVLDHQLQVEASSYTPLNEVLLPTGKLAPVAGTPVDFCRLRKIGERIAELPTGYDHNLVLAEQPRALSFAALLKDGKSGRSMQVYTTEPGLQLYSAHWLDGSLTGSGGVYRSSGGFCLEPQHFPDSPNQPAFPSTFLSPGNVYQSTSEYRFTTD